MTEQANGMPNQEKGNQAAGFFEKAAEACAGGDMLLSAHLYLAAYEQAVASEGASTSVEVSALREAWKLVCDLKERSLAEYVFEKLEPYLTGEEIAECACRLQEMALDRLEQYGFSREDLEDMAESITQDFLGDGAHVVKVESVSIPNMGMFGVPDTTVEATIVESVHHLEAPAEQTAEPEPPAVVAETVETELSEHVGPIPPANPIRPPHVGVGVADVNDFNPYDEFNTSSVGTSYHSCTVEGSGEYVFTRDKDRATELERSLREEAAEEVGPADQSDAGFAGIDSKSPAEGTLDADAPAGSQSDETPAAPAVSAPAKIVVSAPAAPAAPDDSQADQDGVFDYSSLVGYDEAISAMRDIGVGLQEDQGFMSFVAMLNSRHGLSRMPVVDTLLFRAPAIEDASRFVEATVGELGLPVLHMAIEEGPSGSSVLSVTAQSNNRPRMNRAHNRFAGPGILVLEDLEAWFVPEHPEPMEGIGGILMANMSRGAREAMGLIRSAVEDPNVFVLATASTTSDPDPYFYDLLEPITVIDIGYPNDKERADIWAEIARAHPSLRGVDRADLVRLSDGMVRSDMYMAAQEAVEDAYKMGLVRRRYVPVTSQNLFDKLAACQPFDSESYHALEDAVIDDFRNDLDHLEDLLS